MHKGPPESPDRHTPVSIYIEPAVPYRNRPVDFIEKEDRNQHTDHFPPRCGHESQKQGHMTIGTGEGEFFRGESLPSECDIEPEVPIVLVDIESVRHHTDHVDQQADRNTTTKKYLKVKVPLSAFGVNILLFTRVVIRFPVIFDGIELAGPYSPIFFIG